MPRFISPQRIAELLVVCDKPSRGDRVGLTTEELKLLLDELVMRRNSPGMAARVEHSDAVRRLTCGHPVQAMGSVRDEPAHCLWCGDIEDLNTLAVSASRVFAHVTGGQASKPMTTPEAIIALADDETTRLVEEAVAEALREDKIERGELVEQAEPESKQDPELAEWLSLSATFVGKWVRATMNDGSTFEPLQCEAFEQNVDTHRIHVSLRTQPDPLLCPAFEQFIERKLEYGRDVVKLEVVDTPEPRQPIPLFKQLDER